MDIRARIIQCSSKPVSHETEELGTLYLRRMTLGELHKMQEENAKPNTLNEVPIPSSLRLLARFIGDENGQPVFDVDKKEDREALLALPVSVVASILNAGNKVNNMKAETEGSPGKA